MQRDILEDLSRESLRVLDTLGGLKPLTKKEPPPKPKDPFPERALSQKGNAPQIPW